MKSDVLPAGSEREKVLGGSAWKVATWSLVALSLWLCFRGQGHHFWWVFMACFLPACRLGLSGEYRYEWLRTIRESWSSLWKLFTSRPRAFPEGCLHLVVDFGSRFFISPTPSYKSEITLRSSLPREAWCAKATWNAVSFWVCPNGAAWELSNH